MGVFQIKNEQTGKILIGSAKNINGRINRIKFELKNGTHTNKTLQEDFNKIGEASFSFEVLDYLEPKKDLNYDYSEDLKILEEMWVDKKQPFADQGYHVRKK